MNAVATVTRSRTYEVLKGWVAFLAVLTFLGTLTVAVWHVVGGGVNFIVALLAIAFVVFLYSLKNFG